MFFSTLISNYENKSFEQGTFVQILVEISYGEIRVRVLNSKLVGIAFLYLIHI